MSDELFNDHCIVQIKSILIEGRSKSMSKNVSITRAYRQTHHQYQPMTVKQQHPPKSLSHQAEHHHKILQGHRGREFLHHDFRIVTIASICTRTFFLSVTFTAAAVHVRDSDHDAEAAASAAPAKCRQFIVVDTGCSVNIISIQYYLCRW